jgi:hypothetical protein
MISSRRQVHRWLLSVLAILLPWMAVSAVMQRADIPPASGGSSFLFSRADLTDADAQGRLLSRFNWTAQGTQLKGQVEASSSGRGLQLRVTPEGQLNVADPLLYWTPTTTNPVELQQAQVVGSIAGSGPHLYRLPEVVSNALHSLQPGQLLLVNPLNQSVLSTLKLQPVPTTMKQP